MLDLPAQPAPDRGDSLFVEAALAIDQVVNLAGINGQFEGAGETGAALAAPLAANKPAVIHVKVDPQALSALCKDLFRKT